jgi:hypothetical protein
MSAVRAQSGALVRTAGALILRALIIAAARKG